jgi:hypothetical protein
MQGDMNVYDYPLFWPYLPFYSGKPHPAFLAATHLPGGMGYTPYCRGTSSATDMASVVAAAAAANVSALQCGMASSPDSHDQPSPTLCSGRALGSHPQQTVLQHGQLLHSTPVARPATKRASFSIDSILNKDVDSKQDVHDRLSPISPVPLSTPSPIAFSPLSQHQHPQLTPGTPASYLSRAPAAHDSYLQARHHERLLETSHPYYVEGKTPVTPFASAVVKSSQKGQYSLCLILLYVCLSIGSQATNQ